MDPLNPPWPTQLAFHVSRRSPLYLISVLQTALLGLQEGKSVGSGFCAGKFAPDNQSDATSKRKKISLIRALLNLLSDRKTFI